MTKSATAIRRGTRQRKALARAGVGVGFILVLACLLSWTMRTTITARIASAGDNSVGGAFRLLADDGRAVTDRSFPGKYLVIYFGYTSCRDVCPATLNTLSASLARLGAKADRLQPLFITIDPARDTSPVLHRYVGGFSPRLVGLTGSKGEIGKVAQEYRVVSIPHRDDAALDHSSVLYLMAPDGRFVAPLPADASEKVLADMLGKYVS